MKATRNHIHGLMTLVSALLIMVSTNMANAENQKVPERGEIEQQYTWAHETIFPDLDTWEAAFTELENAIPKLEAFKGKLGSSPETLLKFLKLQDEIGPRFGKVYVYASLRADEDTRVGKYQAMQGRLRGLGVKYGQATAWVDPELTAIDWDTLSKWMDQNEELGLYRQSFDDLFRQKKYILPAREEELIALSGQVQAVPYTAYNLLANADLKYPTIKDADGKEVELSDSAFYIFMRSNDRRVRKDAYEGIVGAYRDYRNTGAALLNGVVQSHLFSVRARGYDSCLQAALDGSNIPVEVYNNLIKTVNDKPALAAPLREDSAGYARSSRRRACLRSVRPADR